MSITYTGDVDIMMKISRRFVDTTMWIQGNSSLIWITATGQTKLFPIEVTKFISYHSVQLHMDVL